MVSEKELIEKYTKKGYDHNYMIVDGKLQDLKTKHTFKPTEVQIVAEHRFEDTIPLSV